MQPRIEQLSLKPSLSIRSSMVSNPSTILPVYGATSVDNPPMRISSAGRDGELQRDERQYLQ